MIKQVRCVKVYWNDKYDTYPSFYPDLASATSAIDRVLNFGGRHDSAAGISLKAEVKVLNMDNPHDIAWYNKFVGRTCVDFSPRPSASDGKPSEKTASKPKAKRVPVQMTLPLQEKSATRRAARPDRIRSSLSVSADPARQAAGRAGGLAPRSVKPAPCPDRRAKGSVNFKEMDQLKKREYWRWSWYRKCQRKTGQTPIGFDEWKVLAHKEA